MVKLVGLVTVKIGTPTDAVTCTDLVDLHPVKLFTDSPQYTPGDPAQKILIVPCAAPTYTVVVPDTWNQLVVTFGPKLLVKVKHPDPPAQVILFTVGVITMVGEVKFCEILKFTATLHPDTGSWPTTCQLPGIFTFTKFPVAVPLTLVHIYVNPGLLVVIVIGALIQVNV